MTEADVKDVEFSDVGVPKKGRRGDGGIYLVVADESDEFTVALRYATRLAKSNRGKLGILYVMNLEDVPEWGKVETMMLKEKREQAEKFIWAMAKRANDLNGTIPALYLHEGPYNDVLVDVINDDQAIKMLILGGGTHIGGPGPLVTHFTGKGLGRLRVPVLVVPGHLDQKKIDAIS